MTYRPTDSEIALHREVVKGAMWEILGLREIDGRAVTDIVDEYYNGMRPGARHLALHDDPLRLAYLLSGDSVQPRMSIEDERASLSRLWSEIGTRLGKTGERLGVGDVKSTSNAKPQPNPAPENVVKVSFTTPSPDGDDQDSRAVIKSGR